MRVAELDDLENSVESNVEEDPATAALDHRFCFLNVERRLPEIDWSAEYESLHWTYCLHYFGYAVDLAQAWRTTGDRRYGDRYIELWTDWLDAAEDGRARIEPYPTSMRCLMALWSTWLLDGRLPGAFENRLSNATHAQLVWLSANLERHLGANHLQKNLTALAWGSLAFDTSAARSWSRFRNELWEELREQTLPDGGHFERSPMYHALALDDYLRTLVLSRAAGVAVPEDVPHRLASATRALQWLSRPDGTLHLFNDTANDRRPGLSEILTIARNVLDEDFPEPSGDFEMAESGYFGLVEPDSGFRLLVDAGPLGPSHQPGHAHCDMLSFELDLGGRPVIVDSGVHGYDDDPYREYTRSTRAHNTLLIDDKDQHEMWATFRVARRGEIVEARTAETADGGFEFIGACCHYHDRQAVHRRRIRRLAGGITITDRVEAARHRLLTSWLHLAPDFRIERVGSEDSFIAVADGSRSLRVRIDVLGADKAHVHCGEREPIQGWYCPEFGLALPAVAIELRIESNDGRPFGWKLRKT